ncbi:MAG: acetolactate decarboxylase [Candidatus Bathyarchaeum sp.]|nr:MAG: acetolactate decarboxylase [Candidatus Bathyarchaeum sp.]
MVSKLKWVSIALLVLLIAVVSCVALYFVLQPQLNTNKETVFQVGAFTPFAQGDYDGNVTYAELAKHGDFGLGTLNGLDGEMVAVNGVFYQIPIDGEPRQISSAEETPFAIVTFFEADQTLHVAESMNYSELKAFIDENISPENAIYALKIHGVCDYAKTRSVPVQAEPYPTLTEVIEQQTIFTSNSVTGTMAGFRFPSYMDEVNVAGYHLHFIADDKNSGGHLLDCVVSDATIEIDYTYDYELVLD